MAKAYSQVKNNYYYNSQVIFCSFVGPESA